MKKYDTDDTFLGRWIAGELSETERVAFEKTEAYKQFDIINKTSQLLQGPKIDTEKALENVKQKLKAKQKKPYVIKLWQSIAVAAVLVISAGFVLNTSKTYTTGIGETQNITLSDGSTVNLNANSSLSHKRFFWESSKSVNLTGEAYFTVTKGDGFEVHTSKGTVSVLGTQFNVKNRTVFDLKCYYGKVLFKLINSEKDQYTLTKGMQISLSNTTVDKRTFTEDLPDWKEGNSLFTDQPLSMVLQELSNYYPIRFEIKTVDTNRLFTGRFIHTNLNTALKTTLVPMGISYKKNSTNNVIILSE